MFFYVNIYLYISVLWPSDIFNDGGSIIQSRKNNILGCTFCYKKSGRKSWMISECQHWILILLLSVSSFVLQKKNYPIFFTFGLCPLLSLYLELYLELLFQFLLFVYQLSESLELLYISLLKTCLGLLNMTKYWI